MDFALTEEQEATRDLAHQILTDRETREHLKEIEAGGEGFDRDTWAELAKAGLLGIALPEDPGGGRRRRNHRRPDRGPERERRDARAPGHDIRHPAGAARARRRARCRK